ncbi:hypothetical protein [Paenibacillus eucommiae]|uniref:Fibronectin type-III domain-containing protein n=1 Tax=Paenibacillus eucommiae TaxID=1355755 RepID=A0ABS4J5N5_9BACL|nr:hypothetical protein [Paenibacillus eucommiae]MBP1994421.1 hypothetical protein [Paenibacillus eucommiae]
MIVKHMVKVIMFSVMLVAVAYHLSQTVHATAFTTGSEETVVSKASRESVGLKFWPDGAMGITKSGSNYMFHAANSTKVTRTIGTLTNPIASKVGAGVSISGIPSSYNYAAGGPVYKDPATGTLLMFYHVEIWPGGDHTKYYSLLAMSKSTDDGATWTDLGEIVRPNVPYSASATQGYEVGAGTYVKAGDYFYLYFRDYLAGGGYNNIAVARAKISDVVDAAINSNTVVPWKKYYSGTWTEDGIGGLSDYLETGNPATGWLSASYNTYLNKYIMCVLENVTATNTHLKIIESDDGLNFNSGRTLIVNNSNEYFYPTLVGMGEDPTITDGQFYVYYTSSVAAVWNRWTDAYLARRSISYTGTSAPGSFSLTSPANTSTGVSSKPTLNWADSTTAVTYNLLVDDNSDFSSPVVNVQDLKVSEYTLPYDLAGNTTYYWKVIATNAYGSTSSSTFSFTTDSTGSTTYQAETGFSSTQGANQWGYQYWNGSTYTNMTWDSVNSYWSGTGSYNLVGSDFQHPGNTADSVRKWVAPSDGTITISDRVKLVAATGDGVNFKIKKNGTLFWNQDIYDTTGYHVYVSQTVAAGDVIYFVLNRKGSQLYDSTFTNPQIIHTPDPGSGPGGPTTINYQASSGFSGTQGQNQWYYMYGNGSTYTNMTWDGANSRWYGAGSYNWVSAGVMHPGNTTDAVRKWVAPASGSITITGNVAKNDVGGGDGVNAQIIHNTTNIYNQDIAYNNSTGYDVNLTLSVTAGDAIYFRLNRKSTQTFDLTNWDPVIAFTP